MLFIRNDGDTLFCHAALEPYSLGQGWDEPTTYNLTILMPFLFKNGHLLSPPSLGQFALSGDERGLFV